MMLSTAQQKSLLLLSSIIWFTSSVIGQSTPQFTSPPLGTVKYEREFTTIEIPWKFDYNGGIIGVEWSYMKRGSKTPERIYRISDKEEVRSVPENQFTNRVEFRGDLGRKDATLAIKDILKEDEGDFECKVNGDTFFDRTITIRVSVLSNVTEFEIVDNEEIVEGDNITLSCTTTVGEPSPEIEIKQQGKTINRTMASNTSETTLLYHFEHISKEESGSYFCRVVTDGFISEKELQLKVKYPPEIDRTVKSEQFGCKGKQMSIDCKASGDPKPGVRVIGPDGKRVDENKFTLKAFGVYRCEAFSTLGNDSLNITVGPTKDKPTKFSFSECSFNKLAWPESSDKSVKYTLQVREEGSKSAWADVITSIDTNYSPSTNTSFSEKKDYEFQVVSMNCVGETESEVCIVEGENPSSDERSNDDSNAGVIAGSVIAVLVVILIIVIAAVYWRKKKRGSPSVRLHKESQPMKPTTNISNMKNTNSQKPGGLLYSDSPNIESARVKPPVEYRQDDDEEDDYQNDAPALSNNVPSWV